MNGCESSLREKNSDVEAVRWSDLFGCIMQEESYYVQAVHQHFLDCGIRVTIRYVFRRHNGALIVKRRTPVSIQPIAMIP